MAEVAAEKKMWNDLGRITAFYLAGQLPYAYFVEHSVALSAFGDLPELLQPGKEQIIRTVFYVFLVSWPLALSAAVISYQYEKSELGVSVVLWAIALPFVFHSLLVDRVNFTWSGSPPVVAFKILTYYLKSYKPILFLASILYGYWAGKQLARLSLLGAENKIPPL